MMVYLMISGVILTHLRRPTGRLTVEEQRLEGEFRYINSRLITNSEEIAFYQGNRREKLTLLASYSKLVRSISRQDANQLQIEKLNRPKIFCMIT